MKKFLPLCALSTLGCAAALAADAPFTLTSPDLPAGRPIPERYTADTFGCHGPNESPHLIWSHPPEGTKSFAVTMFDPHRPPLSGWWHWIVYDLPPDTRELARKAGDPGSADLPAGVRQAPPDGAAPQPHYYGPCPDERDPPHQYLITVYALSVAHLNVPATATAANIDYEISTKMLAKATIVRAYARAHAAR